MANGNRRDLYLQVSGDVRGLQTAMSAGKTVINEFGGAAINVIEEVEKEMAKLGTGGMPGLKQVENAYAQTFKRIADSARDVVAAPSGAAASQILDANATRQAAEAANNKARSLRILAEAAQRADQATDGNTAASRAYAVAAASAAVNAEKEADALREQAVVLGAVERELGTAGVAQRRHVELSGQAKAGYQQLSYNLGDVATQYAQGTAASVIFAQQSGQVVQAISLITGETKGFLGFLGGPWGIALSSALVFMTPWVAKLFEGNDALGEAVDKLKKDAEAADVSRQAHAAFTNTLEGQIDAQRRLNEELERGLRTQQQTDAANRAAALSGEVKGKIELAAAERALTKARVDADAARQRVSNPGAFSTPETVQGDIAASSAADRRLQEAEQAKRNAQALIDAAQQNQRVAQVEAAARAAKTAADPTKVINDKYDQMATRASAMAIANEKLASSIDDTLASIERQRASALKAAQDDKKTGPSLGAQLTTSRGADLLAGAKKYTGLSETADNGALQALFKQAGMSVDPKMTAWRAAFVNAVLATNGLSGTGKLNARSFETYGTSTDKPVPGDIVVSKRGTGDQGHVGFFQGVDAKGNIRVLGGNTADKVGTQTVKKSDVLAYRRAPTEGQSQISQDRAADKATQDADAYASLIGRAKEEQLRIERARVVSIDEAAAADRQAVDLAKADLDRAADKGAALGKWTQAEADAVKLITASNAERAKQTITEHQLAAIKQQQLDVEMSDLAGKAELLQLQGDLATTAKDRRRIARELLAIEEKQARDALEQKLVGEKDPVKRGLIQGDIDRLPEKYALRGQQVDQQNEDPIKKYQRQLASFDFNEELETAGVSFFENFNNQLTESATKFVKLKGVAGEFFNQLISDFMRLEIKQALGGGGLLGMLGKLGSAFGIGGGNPLASANALASANINSLASGVGKSHLFGFAKGGWTGALGRQDVAGVVHGQEYVFDADATARIGVGNLEALRRGRMTAPSSLPSIPSVGAAERAMSTPPGLVRIEVGEGAMFAPRVTEISGNVSAQITSAAAPAIVGAATGQSATAMAARGRRAIPQ